MGKSNKESYVYFLYDRVSNAVKIGTTKNIERRKKQLDTGNPNKLELIYYVLGDVTVEQALHKYMELYKIKSEWFSAREVKEWIRRDILTKQVQREMGLIK